MISIVELYRQLFGKGGLKDGTVIDMAEHGRAGGVSTGTPFKTTRGVEEKQVIDVVDSSVTYIGAARMGANEGASVWQIKKILTSGSITQFLYADGDDSYDNEWDERVSLSYS